MKCRYQRKSNRGKDYIKCYLDNSERKYGCPCKKFKPTLWSKIRRRLYENT